MFVNDNTILYSLSRLIRDRFAAVCDSALEKVQRQFTKRFSLIQGLWSYANRIEKPGLPKNCKPG